jgi:hypothetical protein
MVNTERFDTREEVLSHNNNEKFQQTDGKIESLEEKVNYA